MMAKAFESNNRERIVQEVLKEQKNVEGLFEVGIEMDEARQYLKEKSVGFQEFAERFVARAPQVRWSHCSLPPLTDSIRRQLEAFLSDPRIKDFDPSLSTRLSISSVYAIEEDILSPKYGIKGKIDASVQGTLLGPPCREWPLGRETGSILPLEIKTGKSTAVLQHRAQTMLYSLLMSERYGEFPEPTL